MKTTTDGLQTYLNSYSQAADRTLYMCDLFTITLQAGSLANIATGQILTYTTLDVDVSWDGHTFVSNSIQVSGLKYKCTTGTNVDAQQITFSSLSTQTIGGVPFLQALQQGLLDGAEIMRERAFFYNFSGTPPLHPIGTIILFKGRVTKIDNLGRSSAKVTVESDLTLLKREMPWKLFSTQCNWQLYGSGCGLSRSSYTFSGNTEVGSTASVINWSDASTSFQQGSITFTSGENTGITATIKTAATGVITLAYPLPYPPSNGDAFTATWGCDHSRGAQFTGSISGTTLTVPSNPVGIIANGALFGSGVAANQAIVAQLTGTTGLAGTYTVSISQTLGTTPMSNGQGCAKFFNQANFLGFPYTPPPQIITGPLSSTANQGKG